MKINFNFIKTSQLLKQYANQLQSIFVLYDKGDYSGAVKIVGSIFDHVADDVLTIENIKDKNIESFKAAHIYPEAILNDVAIIIHGNKVASKDETITKQDFLTQLTSLHDFLAYLVNIYEDGKVKYWDAQLAYKGSVDKDGLFKPRKVNIPTSDEKIDQKLDLDFDSEKHYEQPVVSKAKPVEKPKKDEKAPVVKEKPEAKPEAKNIKPESKPVVKPVTKPTAKVVVNDRKVKPKKVKKSKGRKAVAAIGVLAIIVAGGIAISQLLEANTQPKTVVSDAKVSRKSSKSKAKAKKLAVQKKKEAARLKEEQARKENWLAGSIYQLDVKTKEISGTVNKTSKRNLALPDPKLNQKAYIVFNPDYTDKKFVNVTDLKTARRIAKSQAEFDKLAKKSKNNEYQFDNDKLTMTVSGLKWAYPMSPYNAIQLSKQGRKKVNNIFASALTNTKLDKKSGKNTFMLTKNLSGNDYSNTSWDNYRANYKIQVSFNKVK